MRMMMQRWQRSMAGGAMRRKQGRDSVGGEEGAPGSDDEEDLVQEDLMSNNATQEREERGRERESPSPATNFTDGDGN
jgi:hypothetical protein